jgi:hypothetical protein
MRPVGALGLGGDVGVLVARAGSRVGVTTYATFVGISVGVATTGDGSSVGAIGDTGVGNTTLGAGGALVGVAEAHAVTRNNTTNKAVLAQMYFDIDSPP